jgi:hypothetical protein
MVEKSTLKELDWAEADIEIVNEVVNSKIWTKESTKN